MRLLRVVLVLGLVVAAVVGYYVFLPFGPGAETFVEVAPGTGTAGIARALEQGGVVRSAWAFEALRVWREVRGGAGTLKAGEYRFDHPATLAEVYEKLRRGGRVYGDGGGAGGVQHLRCGPCGGGCWIER